MGICPIGLPSSRAVFLDRDGVINKALVRDGKPFPPRTLDEFEFVPGIRKAIQEFRRAGFLIIVVTNQPDVARGSQSRAVVEHMHQWLRAELAVNDVFVCWHDDADHCECRKPRPGLVLLAAARYGINLRRSYLIGDRWRDIDAGHNAGCVTLLIDYNYRERRSGVEPAARVASIQDAADWILTNETENRN